MNNAQFKKLVAETPRADRSGTFNGPSATPFGGRRSLVPMTPRSLGSYSADLKAQRNPQKERKRRSVAPLGSKLPEGYVDRTKQTGEPEADEREERLKALMEMVSKGEIDRDVAIEQSKLLGGDVSSTHLVKGLDRSLLERVRRGEDVLAPVVKPETEEEEVEPEEELDVDEELDKVLEKDIIPVTKVKEKKQVPKKRTRAEILAELRQQRGIVTPPVLDSRFKKIQEIVKKPKKSRVKEVEEHVSKKAKRVKEKVEEPKPQRVMGMAPPALPAAAMKTQTEEEDDDDIFAGAGADYDPLAGLKGSDSDDSDDSSDGEIEDTKAEQDVPSPGAETAQTPTTDEADMPPPPPPTAMPPPPPRKVNYFGDSKAAFTTSEPITKSNLTSDPDLMAAIKRATAIADKAKLPEENPEKAAKHKAMFAMSARDDEDVDMGFGGSRTFGDDDDDDGPIEDDNKMTKKRVRKRKEKE